MLRWHRCCLSVWNVPVSWQQNTGFKGSPVAWENSILCPSIVQGKPGRRQQVRRKTRWKGVSLRPLSKAYKARVILCVLLPTPFVCLRDIRNGSLVKYRSPRWWINLITTEVELDETGRMRQNKGQKVEMWLSSNIFSFSPLEDKYKLNLIPTL